MPSPGIHGATGHKQGNLSPGLLLIALLAAFGISAPLLRSPAQPSAPVIAPSKGNRVSSFEHSAQNLLEEFFDADPDQIEPDRPWSDNRQQSPGDGWGNDPHAHDHIGFLITTLPDPSTVRLRYEFDSYFEALEQALGADGYLLDRFDLPWMNADDEQSASPETDRRPRTRPGIVLFRREAAPRLGEPSDSLLVLFLIGETPTSGVNLGMLRSALDQVAWLSGWMPGRQPAPRRILDLTRSNAREVSLITPTYSGSAVSLQNALRNWRASFGAYSPPGLRLFSGTATAISQWPGDLGTFRTTQVPDGQSGPAMLHFLHEQLNQSRVAILAENTAYGRSLQPQATDSGATPAVISTRSPVRVLWLPFPLHISEVRTVFGNAGGDSNAIAQNVPNLSRRNLPIAEDKGQTRPDVVPAFSRRSAVYDELILSNILSTIHREHVRYVGIIATDVEDVIFLVRKIRQNCPDTIAFLTSSDMLYVHSEFNSELKGTLVFSTYPLFSMNQLWTWPYAGARRRIQFPSGEAEGIYNAMLAALGGEVSMVDYSDPLSTDSSSPPLWLSVVGNDGLWPIRFEPVNSPAVFKRSSSALSPTTLPISLGFNLYPRAFEVTFLLAVFICLVPSLMLLRRFPVSRDGTGRLCRLLKRISPRESAWLAMFMSDAVNSSRVLERRLCFLSLAFVLLTVDIVVVSVFALPLRVLWGYNRAFVVFGLWSFTRAMVVAAVVILLVGLTAVTALSVFSLSRYVYREWRRPLSAAPFTTWITALASGIAVLLACGFAISIWQPQGEITTALFYFVRTANMWNGVSVLLPLMFLGVAAVILGSGELLRLNLLESCGLTSPFLGFNNAKSFTGVDDGESRIIELLECPAEKLPNAALWICLPPVIFLYLVLSGLSAIPIDGKFFALFFGLVEMFVSTSFLIVFARFICVWLEMRRFLARLYFHPMRQSYEKLRAESLPPSVADQQTIRVYEAYTSLTAVEFCLQQARRLIERLPLPKKLSDNASARLNSSDPCAANDRTELSDAVVEAETHLATVLEAEALKQWRDAIVQRGELQRAMARLSAKVVEIFEPQWRLAPSQSPDARDPADPVGDSGHPLVETANLFVAARVVDFLRRVFPQMRSMVVIATAGLLAMMLAANTYTFPMRDTIGLITWTVLLIVVAVTIAVFVQINRSRIISMLSGTAPGQLSWDSGFVWHVLILGVLPILTLLGTQFPYTLQRMFGWLGGIVSGAQ